MINDNALELLRKANDFYIGCPLGSPQDEYREGSRAILNFFSIKWFAAIPRAEVIKRSLAMYAVTEGFDLDESEVNQALVKMLNRGENKVLRSTNRLIEVNF